MSDPREIRERATHFSRVLSAAVWKALSFVDAEIQFAADVRRREPMNDETFHQAYYAKSGIPFHVSTTVRRIYGEQLGHDPLRLRADDFDPAL